MPENTAGVSNIDSAINNCLSNKELDAVLHKTCDFIYDVLSQHCGPLSEYAFIKDVNNPTDDGTFTKDGIGIVRSLSFQTPIQTSLKNAVAHIGSCVETAAADGTTSSMMLSIYTLKHLRMNEKIRKMPVAWLNGAWKIIESEVKRMYTNPKESDPKAVLYIHNFPGNGEEDWKDHIRRFAYAQTYTSSHGDIGFSKKVADLFASVPDTAWKTIQIKRSEWETEENYEIEVDRSQWNFSKIGIQPFEARLSENMEGTLIRENEKVIFSQNAPLINGDMDSQQLLKDIVNSIVNDEKVSYFCSGNSDANSRGLLDKTFAEHPESHTTVIYIYNEEACVQSDLLTMPLLIDGYDGAKRFNITLSYKTNGKGLQITNGLHNFKVEDTICMNHPWLEDDKHKDYNEYVKNIKAEIDRVAIQYDKSKTNMTWYESLRKLYNKLTVINRVSFIIGGSLYNNLTAVDIVHDTLPAVRRTLEKGFCRGENKSLYLVLQRIIDEMNEIKENKIKKEEPLTAEEKYRLEVVPFICRTIMNGIENLHEITHQITLKKNKDGSAKSGFDPNAFEDAVSGITWSDIKDFIECKELKSGLVIQPIDTDLELIKRFGEMMIRFIKTNKMITVGTLINK